MDCARWRVCKYRPLRHGDRFHHYVITMRLDSAACGAPAHYLFLSPHTHGSTVMRGHLSSVVIGMTSAFHNATASFIRLHNSTAHEERRDVEEHLRRDGARGRSLSACIFIKEMSAMDGAVRSCRRHGALALLDCVDSPTCFDEEELASLHGEHRFDGLLAQTAEHAGWLVGLGYAAATVPHPHGDAAGWAAGARSPFPPTVDYAWPKHMPAPYAGRADGADSRARARRRAHGG